MSSKDSCSVRCDVRARVAGSFLRRLIQTASIAAISLLASGVNAQIAFDEKTLQFNTGSISGGTSLQFGPDGLLYVSEYPSGTIKVFDIERNDVSNEYEVLSSETIQLVKDIPNHMDDGDMTVDPDEPDEAGNPPGTNREVTGLVVGGTLSAVEVYVTSSDAKIGGPSGDKGVDTNSGVITRLTRDGVGGWEAVDLVRGLPRSEENHAPNGLELVTIGTDRYLIVAVGGLTNAGSPSNNFAFIGEYALSAAVLAINLTILESMPVQTDTDSGRQYVYDLPTLDDPTRANVNGIVDPNDASYDGIDVGDPWGGNDGLNMAMAVPGGPVQVFSPGYRNAYDLVVTASGAVYVTDNGANGGWGGYPENEATANVTNAYRAGEPGSSSTDVANSEPSVNNNDHLNLVTTDIQSYVFGSIYGGHPSPVRANVNAGLYTRGAHTDDPVEPNGDGVVDDYFRTILFDPNGSAEAADPGRALPANWPPVPASLINLANGDYRAPGQNNPDSDGNGQGADGGFDPFIDPDDDITVTIWENNTNGIDEYTASNFGGQLQGNLIAGESGEGGDLHRVELNPDGTLSALNENWVSGIGGNPLGITAQGDTDKFPGTIWVATFNSNIVILEPNDFVVCILPPDPAYDPSADNDFDGFTNQDEFDNGTDRCSGASQPPDFDGDKVSDLNDPDDDGDGTDDEADPFQLGAPRDLLVINELFSDQTLLPLDQQGYLGLALTGLMNNGAANPNWLLWIDRRDLGTGPNDILGGAIGAVTIQQTGGTAAGGSNSQEKAFQYGVNVGTSTGPYVVEGRMQGFNEVGQIYDFVVDAGDGPPSQGIFIGTGFQDSYIELVLTQAGVTLREEVADATGEQLDDTLLLAERPQGIGAEVVLSLLVDPAAGTVEGQYIIDGGSPVSIGTVAAEGTVLAAIQNDGIPLAVGLIGTSGAPKTADPNDDKEFGATWDYLNVTGSAPFVAMPLADIERQVDAPAEMISLDDFFDDDNGTANLAYSLQSNTNPAIGAVVAGNMLTLTFPSTAETTSITIRATDADTLFTEQTFTVTVSDVQVPIVRINAGGPAVTADDGGPNWVANTVAGGPDSGPGYAVNTGNISTQNLPASQRHSSVPANISDTVFTQLYANERWDAPAVPEMLWSITLPTGDPLPSGDYEVRLYFGNGFAGTSAPGARVFDVNIEGGAQEITGLDLSATYGHQVGAMQSYVVNVTDGTLNIEFFHDVENPLINAIEVLGAAGVAAPISVGAIASQTSFEGFMVSLPVTASGGDGALNYSAVGLPSGVMINPVTGVISGTVAAGAAAMSPYSVVVTVDDADADNTDAKTASFTWDINLAPTPGAVQFRINTGGPLLSDPALDWSEDQSVANAGGTATTGTPSAFLDLSGGSTDTTFGAALTGINNTGAPNALFTTERYSDVPGTADNMQYDIPATSGNYIVNLYFAEIYGPAQTPGGRVFDVLLEGQIVADDLDQTVQFGANNAGVISIPVTVSDDNLDIDFVQGIQNPNIKGIEVLAAEPPANPDASAQFVVDTGADVDSSSFDGGFSITNNSTNGLKISSVSVDLSTAIMPEFVFDPLGTAGDPTAKCFEEVTGGTATGLLTDGSGTGTGSCQDPFSGPRGVGGYDILTIDFSDFDAGETFEFAVDVDPTSISSDEIGGKASGLELTGSTVSISFDDGSTTLITELYRIQPDSLGGSQNSFLPTPLVAPPGLTILGAIPASGSLPGAQNATINTLTPVAQVFAPAGSNVTLLAAEVEKTVVTADPFEANRLLAATEYDVVVGGTGVVNIPLSLVDATDDDLNYLAAVIVQPDGRTTRLSTVWRLNYDPTAGVVPQAMIQVNPGGDLASTTFGTGSFVVGNIGTDNISSVTFDLSTGFLPDVVFDPVGTAGDAGAKCFTADSGAVETGLLTDGSGVGPGSCADPFSEPHNGVNGDDGFDVLTIQFDDFQGGELFTFSIDNDPTSIKNDTTAGDAGAISGFELIGSTVTVNFESGNSYTASLFDEGSLGGSMAIVESGSPAAPSLSLVGNTAPIALPGASQSILVSGTPNANVWLLQVDARLYIDAGGGGYDIDPFEANDAMAKVIGNVTIDPDGDTETAVTLLATPTGDAGPDGSINHFIAVEDSAVGVKSLASNIVVVELDPTVVVGGTLDGTISLQGRTDNSGDVEVTLYDLSGVQVGSPVVATADASGQFSVPGITPGMYQVAVKHPKYLQTVQIVDIVAGTTANDFGETRAGDANGDNFVTLVDFSVLASTFNLASGQPGFDDRADFNGDGVVSLVDFSLLASNFNTAGEEPAP